MKKKINQSFPAVPEKIVCKTRQLKNGWIKVVMGRYPIYRLIGPCRLMMKHSYNEKVTHLMKLEHNAIWEATVPICILEGQYFKIE